MNLLKPYSAEEAENEAADKSAELSLKKRRTQELVVALVGPVGAGVTTTGTILKQLFTGRYEYEANEIRVSSIISEGAALVGKAVPPDQERADHIQLYQDIGTALRQKFGEPYLADKCIERIGIHRKEHGGYSQVNEGPALALPRRTVHIIDSLKNPGELERLRDVYGETLWVFGVFAPEALRQRRLEAQRLDSVQVLRILKIDEEEGVGYGQRVRDTIQHADFFVRNDGEDDANLKKSLKRYLDLIFGVDVHTPTQHESAMYEAASAATRSACLSRQVGAVIYSKAGELIGLGDNDVPKYGGGLYEEGRLPAAEFPDHRCFKWAGKICHNDEHKGLLYKAIFNELRDAGLLAKSSKLIDVATAVRKTDVKNLIEFSRAVHAEMEAIVSVARGQKCGIVGSTMYTTTYPCHNCARHIVASGITTVFYVEPYAKSLAIDLHSDAISQSQADSEKVHFLQYEGVAPKNIFKLFKSKPYLPRKEDGHVVTVDPKNANPVFPSPLDGFDRREQIVVASLVDAEERARAAVNDPTSEAGSDVRKRAVELPFDDGRAGGDQRPEGSK